MTSRPLQPRPLSAKLARRARRARRRAWIALRPLRRASARSQPGSPSQLHLSWQEDPRTTLTVTWTTPAGAGPACVEFGPLGTSERRRVAATSTPSPGSHGTLHRATLTGLEPGTAIAYRVSADAGAPRAFGAWHTSRTAPASADASVRAAFVSDVGLAGRADGTTRAQPAVLQALAEADAHVVLGGGDYAYADNDARYRDHADAIDRWWDELEPVFARTPFMAQYGNHDVELGERYEDWAPRLAHPAGSPGGRSYSFDLGAAHFVALHAPGRAPGEDDVAWLERDLASEQARAASWRVVYQHAPPFAAGRCHPARPDVTRLTALFERLGVDLHLSAHDQSYERTHALRGGIATPPKSSDGRVHRYAAGDGPIYAKISPAGKLSERGLGFSTFAADAPPVVAARDDAHHHWGVLDIDRDVLRLRVEAISSDGERRPPIEEIALEAARGPA